MAADNKPTPSVHAVLDGEFVPMSVAAATAYFDITDRRRAVGSQAELAELARLVAIALSTVAPVYRETQEGRRALASEEINAALFKARPASLEGLAIRRADLERAIETLREARASFGPP